MKILCGISGIEFSCDHFPGTFYAREAEHPVFSIPQRKLLTYIKKWAGGELTSTDSYLLFLAVLKSTDLVTFRVPCIRTPETDMIIAQNMEALMKTAVKLNTLTNPEEVFNHVVISLDSRTLVDVGFWVKNWDDQFADFKSGYINAHDSRIAIDKLTTRQNALARMIKNPHKNISNYATQVADWAAVAGSFPEFQMFNPFTKLNTTLSDYWRTIIIRCAKSEYLFTIPEKDLTELIEHCEENIPIGSIFSNALFKLLRAAKEKKDNFLGLGDMDLGTTTYRILQADEGEEASQLKAIIDSAPEEEPRREQYPNMFQFIRAKSRWEQAKIHGRNNE